MVSVQGRSMAGQPARKAQPANHGERAENALRLAPAQRPHPPDASIASSISTTARAVGLSCALPFQHALMASCTDGGTVASMGGR